MPEAMEGSGGTGSRDVGEGSRSTLTKKLSHPLEEIRCRAMKTLLQKLDLGFLSISDLGAQLELVRALLKWFNFPSRALRGETLNLLLTLSKEESGCKSLVTAGAIQFLTELRMESSALESQTIDAIMQNVIMKTDRAAHGHFAETGVAWNPLSCGDSGSKSVAANDNINNNNNDVSDPALPLRHLPLPVDADFHAPPLISSSRSLSYYGGTPRGIIRDVDPQLLDSLSIRSVLNASAPPLSACDAATLASAITALYEAASAAAAAAAVDATFIGVAEACLADTAAAEATRSTLVFVEDVVLKDFPVEYLTTTMRTTDHGDGIGSSTDDRNFLSSARFGVDLVGALVDSVLVWKEKFSKSRSPSTDVSSLRILCKLLETLERFLDKLIFEISKSPGEYFRRQFVVEDEDFEENLLTENDSDETAHQRNRRCDDRATHSNPFRYRRRDEDSNNGTVVVGVCIVASVIIETLCGLVADVLRPLDRAIYQSVSIGRNIASSLDHDDDVDDPLGFHGENSMALRFSVIAVDIVAKASSLLLEVATPELDFAEDGGYFDTSVAVFERSLVPLGDVATRLTWKRNGDNVGMYTPLKDAITPTRAQLWTYVHMGATLCALSKGFLDRFSSPMDSASVSALPPRRRPRPDPHEYLPPSCVSSLHLLALDPFFHSLFPRWRGDCLLPILSHVKPDVAGKIVDALDVSAVLSNTHFRIKAGIGREGADNASDTSFSIASVIPYLSYTLKYDVIPVVVSYLTRPCPHRERHHCDVTTLMGLLAHPSSTIRSRVYSHLSDVVCGRLEELTNKSAVEISSGINLEDEMGFLMPANNGKDLWYEIIFYGLNDGNTTGCVEKLLTAVIDHGRTSGDAFLEEVLRQCVVPALPFLTGFSAVKHAFASTIAAFVNDIKRPSDRRGKKDDETKDSNFLSRRAVEGRFAVLKTTLALLFSRDKDWRREGMRRFLAFGDAGTTFLNSASMVEVEIFADAFVKSSTDIASGLESTKGKTSRANSSSLDDVRRIFCNSSAAADVRSTAARTLSNAITDHKSLSPAMGASGVDVLATCLAELRRVDNVASPPILGIDDTVPAVVELMAKMALDREFRRKLSSTESRWKCPRVDDGDIVDRVSSEELMLILCRLCVKYRKNSVVVDCLAILLSSFAFVNLEKGADDEDGGERYGSRSFPPSLLRRFSLPFVEAANDADGSPNCDPSSESVHQNLENDGTLCLVKYAWSQLMRSEQANEENRETTSCAISPLDFSPEEEIVSIFLNAGGCFESATRHVSAAACHEHVAVVVSFLTFPALNDAESAREGDHDVLAHLFRFFHSPPASAEDEELFVLVLRLLTKRLELSVAHSCESQLWFHRLIFGESFPPFLRDLLAGVSSDNGDIPSYSSSAVALLNLLCQSPTCSGYSLNAMTICVNWLGSGLDLSRPGVVLVVEAAAELMTKTILARMEVIVDEKEPVLKEALRILCHHCCNVIRLLLARRNPDYDVSSSPTAQDSELSLVFGSAAAKAAANALLVSFHALRQILEEREFQELISTTLLSSTDTLWFVSALSSPSPTFAALFWSLLRLCCVSSTESLSFQTLTRQFPEFLRVCVETSFGVVVTSPIVKREALHCLLRIAYCTTETVADVTKGSTKHSLRNLLIRYDLTEYVNASLSPKVPEDSYEEELHVELNVVMLRLFKWFVEERMIETNRINPSIAFLLGVFVGIPLGNEDEACREDENEIDNLSVREDGVDELVTSRLGLLSTIADALLSLVIASTTGSRRIDSDTKTSTTDAFFGLSSRFFERAFGLFSVRYVHLGDVLWKPLMALIALLIDDVAESSTPQSSTVDSCRTETSSLYPVAIAMLKNKDSLMDLFVVSGTLPRQTVSSSLLTSLYRFCGYLMTRLGRDADCLEILDGLFDIPHKINSDETHGSLLTAAVYRRFVNDSDGRRSAGFNVSDGSDDASFPRPPPSPVESAAASLLQRLVVVSSTAKTAALFDLSLLDYLVNDALTLEASLSLDSLNGGHNADGSIPASDAVLRRLLARIGVLTNVLTESDEARSMAMNVSSLETNVGIGRLFHRLWSWVEIDESIAESFFSFVGAFAADNPIGIANALCTGPKLDAVALNNSRCSSSSGKSSPLLGSSSFSSSFPSASLIHAMTQYASQSRPATHIHLQRRCFVLLGQMASLSPEVRGVLTKTHFLENGFCRLNPKKVSTSSVSSLSSFPLHSAWLDFVCTITMDANGQAMVFKAGGAVDLLIEYLNTSSGSTLSSSLPSSASSLRQKSALALHNLCFSSKNVTLFARETFLPSLIRRATQLSTRSVADRKTTLICCAALWALATRLKKNTSLMKGTDCREKLKETVYKLSRSSGPDSDSELTARHVTYCQKIISVLDS